MKDNELLFDLKSHVLYSKPCKKEILAKIALHRFAIQLQGLAIAGKEHYVELHAGSA